MFNRDTMMIVAVIVSLAATIYLFREFQKQKQDVTNVKYYVSRKLSQTPANDARVTAPEPTESVEPVESAEPAESDED